MTSTEIQDHCPICGELFPDLKAHLIRALVPPTGDATIRFLDRSGRWQEWTPSQAKPRVTVDAPRDWADCVPNWSARAIIEPRP